MSSAKQEVGLKTIPKTVRGTEVFASGDQQEFSGGLWVTLVPEDSRDDRLWEFDLRSVRVLQTEGHDE